jgi:hypothetical protein
MYVITVNCGAVKHTARCGGCLTCYVDSDNIFCLSSADVVVLPQALLDLACSSHEAAHLLELGLGMMPGGDVHFIRRLLTCLV